jgi:hypothetical protein
LTSPLDSLPGFRRRFVITPGPRWVSCAVEDDYHRMSVTIRHAAGVAVAVEPVLERAPWTTCPSAVAQLVQTFTGVALDAFAARARNPRTARICMIWRSSPRRMRKTSGS